MSVEPTDPCSLRAARALSGESVGLVTGMTFASPQLLAEVYAGDIADPVGLIAATARALKLDFTFVNGVEPWAERAASALSESGVAVFWVVDGPFSHAAGVLGPMEAIRSSAANPEALRPALDAGAAAALSSAARGFAACASALVVAEDLAGGTGPLVAPDFVHEELMPRIDLLVREAQSRRRPAVLHSDGDVRVFVPAIARTRFDAVHGGGPNEGTFIELLREARRFGLRVVGGIGSETLGRGADAAAHAGAQARLLALPGDVLVADDGGMTGSEELLAFARALEAARGENE